MRKLTLAASATGVVLMATASGPSAQQPRDQITRPDEPAPIFRLFDAERLGPGMFGPGMMMGPGGLGMMMGPGGLGMMGHGWSSMMVIMMDSDGDGAVSRDEYQALQSRIFDAMDLDGDGHVTAEEMATFMWGGPSGGDAGG